MEPSPRSNSTESESCYFFIANNDTETFPSLILATQLARYGLNCEVHQRGQKTINIVPQTTTTLQNNSGGNHNNEVISVHIHSGHDMDSIQEERPYTLLLPTQATPSGIRYSFLQLKHYLEKTPPLRTGITITNTSDQALARQYFMALNKACQKFLPYETPPKLHSYGLINHNPHHESTPELNGIARLIFNDCVMPPNRQHFNNTESLTPQDTTHSEE